MSKYKPVIVSKNGKENIELNRSLCQDSNTKESNQFYELLITQPMSSYHNNQPTIKKSNSNRLIKDPNFNNLVKYGDKCVEEILTHCAGKKGYESAKRDYPETVSLEMISQLAKEIVSGPVGYQAIMALKPNRQKIDETVQHAILEKYLPNWKIEKLNEGYLTIHDGEFVYKSAGKIAKSNEASAKSIDFICEKVNMKVYVFSKYAKVAGGVQDHQMKESGTFIHEVAKLLKKHPNLNIKFIDLLDGKYAESKIDHHKNLIEVNAQKLGLDVNKLKETIFVGNCEQVIDWINSL